MLLSKQINQNSPLNNDDFIDIIENFEPKGEVIDDRGRNKIKIFKVKEHIINVKSFKVPNLINKVVYKYFRESKAERSFKHANILLDKGIGTPKPFAYYEFTTALYFKKSYFFSEHLNYDLTFRELTGNIKYPDYENILRQFTRFTFQMHELGIYFKDHSPGNTLIVKQGKNYEFYLIDLNRMVFHELDFNARMKNFSRLTSEKEMVKMMSKTYAKLSGVDFEKNFDKMWFYTKQFQEKFHKKKRLKQMLFIKK
ncbi:MAG: Kdo domain containing protein [Flavobacteriaceae bacterium]|nr:Kdo domain containing protein [Flavobacteriaceae bacterium]